MVIMAGTLILNNYFIYCPSALIIELCRLTWLVNDIFFLVPPPFLEPDFLVGDFFEPDFLDPDLLLNKENLFFVVTMVLIGFLLFKI
mgnify:CR=1 FL=1